MYSKVIQLYIYIHVSILFQILFPFRLFQNIEQSFLCYTVGRCWLSILNIAVCTCLSQTPNPSPRPFAPRNHKFVLWVCFYFVNKFTCIFFFFFLDSAYKWYHMIFVFVWLTSLSMIISGSIHVAANGIISFYLMAE